MKNILAIGLSMAMAVLLGCAATKQSGAGQEGAVEFPEQGRSYLLEGDFIDPYSVQRVETGLSKDQVRLRLGKPHFSEGIFRVREWNYIFNFYTGEEREYIVCQYKVLFDDDGRVVRYHWNSNECTAFVNSPEVADIGAAEQPGIPLTLSSDALFVFGKSGIKNLKPGGRQSIAQLVQSLDADFGGIQSVRVVGHTDRIGSAQANLALSQARAETIKTLLVDLGVSATLIDVEGRGAAAPLVDCKGEQVTPELVSCLEPNRRVEVLVRGS